MEKDNDCYAILMSPLMSNEIINDTLTTQKE